MITRSLVFAVGLALVPGAAVAQAAAESAIILGGTGAAAGRGARSMGSAIAGAMGNAANAVGAANRGATTYQPPRRRGGGGDGQFMLVLPGNVDPLDKTDAPTYAMPNGAAIRVSGGLRRPPRCTANCPK